MDALRQIVQSHSNILTLKLPDRFSHQSLEIIILPRDESTNEAKLTESLATMPQILAELAEFQQRFDETRQFSDSVDLVREDRGWTDGRKHSKKTDW